MKENTQKRKYIMIRIHKSNYKNTLLTKLNRSTDDVSTDLRKMGINEWRGRARDREVWGVLEWRPRPTPGCSAVEEEDL
jgi:hypothetical protein